MRRLLAGLALPAAVLAWGCGSGGNATSSATHPLTPTQAPRPALGLIEDNAELLSPPASATRSGGSAYAAARERLTALHPRYIRLLIDWAALQPERDRPPALQAQSDGCARAVGPCASYRGVRAELAAIADQQRAARAQGRAAFEVVLDLFGAPAWAANAPSGCELADARPFSRPLSEAGLAGYRALIRSLLALGRSEGVALEWWSPWNEPNDPVFLSPQRASCTVEAPTLAPGVYAQLAEAMAGELGADGEQHQMLLGELNAFATDSVHRTSVASFVAALPERVLCFGSVWAIHAYAAWGDASPKVDPVATFEHDLDARGSCARHAQIWVTEAGAGAPHPGRRRPPGGDAERAGCDALAGQLEQWARDPRVGAVFQYSFREDPAFPVGLLSADLSHVYPAYGVWLRFARARAQGQVPAALGAACA